MKPSRVLQAAVSGLLTPAVLAGCTSTTTTGVSGAPVPGGGAADTGAAAIAAGDGGNNLGATMPKDFPREVPLPRAELTNATTLNAVGKRSWTLAFETTGPAQDAFRAETLTLQGQGFTVTVIADAADNGGAICIKGPFTIALTSGTTQLQLTVSRSAI